SSFLFPLSPGRHAPGGRHAYPQHRADLQAFTVGAGARPLRGQNASRNSSSHRTDITGMCDFASLLYRRPVDNRDRLMNLVEAVRLQ
ncbi:MAG: hypothetical protein ABI577_19395, partial [bacterium]